MDYDTKIDHHLDLACKAESDGNKGKAETEFKRAAFYDARNKGVDVKSHVPSCTPAY